MKGYNILEELYTSIAHRSVACTLILENGFEITGTYCIDMNELINEDSWKQKSFQSAYHEYMKLVNAMERQTLFSISLPIDIERGEFIGKESV